MINLKAKLDLKKLPFSRTGSSYYLFEEDNRDGTDFQPGIYFGISYVNGASRREGLVRIVPMKNGEPLEYVYDCTPSRLKLTTEKGCIILVLDKTDSMRFYSEDGIGLVIRKEMPVMSLETVTAIRPGVAEDNLFVPTGGGGRIIFSRVKGDVQVEADSGLVADGINRYTIWLLPDGDGCLETAVTSIIPAEGEPVHKPLENCIAEVEAEFSAFMSNIAPVPRPWGPLRETCAYMCWINARKSNPGDMASVMPGRMFCASRLSDMQCLGWHQPFFSLIFSDGPCAVKTISNVYPAVRNGMLPMSVYDEKLCYGGFPVYQGWALIRLLDRFGDGVLTTEEVKGLYEAMKANYLWWKESHSFAPGRMAYLYPVESGFPGASYAELEFPLETPDLYAWMSLYAEVIGRIERLAQKGNGLTWYAESRALLNILLQELWDGEAFVCRGMFSGRKLKSDSLLTLIPIVLGKRLPEDIITKLTSTLCCENRFLTARGLVSENMLSPHHSPSLSGCGSIETLQQVLIISGLRDAGATDAADMVSKRILSWAENNVAVGSYPPEGELSSAARPGDVYEATAASALIAIAAGLPPKK